MNLKNFFSFVWRSNIFKITDDPAGGFLPQFSIHGDSKLCLPSRHMSVLYDHKNISYDHKFDKASNNIIVFVSKLTKAFTDPLKPFRVPHVGNHLSEQSNAFNVPVVWKR